MTHLISIFLPLIFFSVSCIGIGILVLRFMPKRPEIEFSTEVILAFLMGQGVLGTLFLAPALLGKFSLPILLTITAPFACFGLWILYAKNRILPLGLNKIYVEFRNSSLLWKITSLSIAFILIASSASMAGLVTGDARAFYLALPKVVAASHRLIPLPMYESFMSVGLLAEMQLAALFLLGMPGASPRLFCWLTGLAASVILLAIGKNAGLGRRGQLVSVTIMVTSSAVMLLWGQGKTDFFAAAYGLAAVFYALKSWDTSTRKISIVLTGLFTGFALVAKLSYIVAFLPSIFIIIFWKEIPHFWTALCVRKEHLLKLRILIAEGLIFVVAMLPALLPHFTKNVILVGTLIDTYGSHQYFNPETTQHIVLTYPLLLIFGDYWAQYGNMSPLMLAFLPLALLMPWSERPRNGPIAALSVAALTGLLAWIAIFPSVPMPRYFLATLLLPAVPIGWVAERFSRLNKLANYIVTLAMLLTILIFFKSWRGEIFPIRNAFQYLFTVQTEKAFTKTELFSYNVYEALNNTAKPGARVFLLSYYRFWLRPDLIQCSNRTSEDIKYDAKDPNKFWLQLYENDFTYLYSNTYLSKEIINKLPSWVMIEEVYPKSIHGEVYRLAFKNAPGKVHLTTHEVFPGVWDVVPLD